MAKEKSFLLKDDYFNEDTVSEVVNSIKSVYANFNGQLFLADCLAGFPSRELKDRMVYMQEVLSKYLPSDYTTALDILLSSLNYVKKAKDFTYSCYTDFVREHGCKEQYLDISLNALGEFTEYFSAEFAIRRFINEFPKESYQKILKWSHSNNLHQRRLASEGLRPKLPWAVAIKTDYIKAIEVLNNLYYDDVRYVTRSVANHLNDISKIDADLVLTTLKQWKNENKQQPKEMDYVINHSLRTLVKKGHSDTLEFLGFSPNAQIVVSDININNSNLKLGDYLVFDFNIVAKEDVNLIIDYLVTYPTPHKRLSQKVFKISKTSLKQNEELIVNKKHLFASMTTKRLYAGRYLLEVQINGGLYSSAEFFINGETSENGELI